MDDKTGDDTIGKDWLTVVSADKVFDVVKIENPFYDITGKDLYPLIGTYNAPQ